MKSNNKKPKEFYAAPKFYDSDKPYQEWLYEKAKSHHRRDKKRSKIKFTSTQKDYRIAIHKAVIDCNGFDVYTKEKLNWKLIGKYNNKKSKKGGRDYKSKFAYLPTIDHTYENTKPVDIVICGWRVNDAKNDLKIDDFLELCELVIKNYKK